jgi:hypothetical protein
MVCPPKKYPYLFHIYSILLDKVYSLFFPQEREKDPARLDPHPGGEGGTGDGNKN